MKYILPELGEGVYEAELVEWRVRAGDRVDLGDTLAEVLTDKATMELPSPFSGVVQAFLAEPGDVIKIGDAVLEFETAGGELKVGEEAGEGERGGEGEREKEIVPVGRKAATRDSRSRAAPSVRRLARELAVDIDSIAGSGPGGRVLMGDVETAAEIGDAKAAKREGGQGLKRGDEARAGERIKLRGVRRMIAEQMVKAKRIIPHYGLVDECDATELVRLRESLKETLAARNVRLTYLAFFVKAAAAALREFPIVNSSLDDDAAEIVLHDRYHIGIAVAAPAGLIVPVIHDADRRDVAGIAAEIERLSGEARAGRSRREDLQGGTFTISSIGGIGGLISTPVINHPQAAIMGIGKIVKRPVYDEAEHLRPADILYLSFSFDHRVLDGDVAARFAGTIIGRLENPATLLVESR